MLRQNTGLRVLSLGKHRMRDLGARLLAQYLQENSTLEELRLEWCASSRGDASPLRRR